MITDKHTNHLYLSGLLAEKFPAFFLNFIKELNGNNIVPEFLPDTKDVWCVDYMPIQIKEDEFIQFRYFPKYLNSKKYLKTISDTKLICEKIGISPITTDIILDGGNVIRSDNKAIMTTRVIEENSKYELKELTEKIVRLLQIDELVYIPQQPNDFTGHSDGMVRFINNDSVIINDNSKETQKGFKQNLIMALRKSNLEIIEIPTGIYDNVDVNDAAGDYLNYLHMDGIIFLPIFQRAEDDIVIKIFEKLFSGTKIVPIISNDLAKEGGIINCITWNIMRPQVSKTCQV